MIKGIGIDMVNIQDIRMYIEDEKISSAYIQRTYTQAESAAASQQPDMAEYYATRFAAKEATFKALAHLTAGKNFDLRLIETLNHPDGSPYIHLTEPLQEILNETNVTRLHISITTEDDYATAFVIAEDSGL